MAANKNPKKVVRLLASSGDDGTITVHVVANTQNDVNTHAEGNNGEEITIKPEELISDNQSPMEVNSSSDFVKDITDDTTAEDMISETTLPEGLCRKENQPGVWTNALIPEGKCFGPYEKNVDIGMIQPQQQTYYLPHIIRNRIYDDEQCNIQMIEDSTGENVYYRTLVNVAKDTELIALENINEEWSFTSVPNSDNIHEANCEDGVNLAVENAHPDILTDDFLVENKSVEDVEPIEIIPLPIMSNEELPHAFTADSLHLMDTFHKWNCQQCDEEFDSFLALRMHSREAHDEDPIKNITNSLEADHSYCGASIKIECPWCEESFMSEKLVAEHIRQFHQQFESDDHAELKLVRSCEDGVNSTVENAHPDIITDDFLVKSESAFWLKDVEPIEIIPQPLMNNEEFPHAFTADSPHLTDSFHKWKCWQIDDEFYSSLALKMHLKDTAHDTAKNITNYVNHDHTYRRSSDFNCFRKKKFRSNKILLANHTIQLHQQCESDDQAGLHEANCEAGGNLAVENVHPYILTDDFVVKSEDDVDHTEPRVAQPFESGEEFPHASTADTPDIMTSRRHQPVPVVVVPNEKASLIRWNCEQCDDSFSSFRALKMHMRKAHDGDAIQNINNCLKVVQGWQGSSVDSNQCLCAQGPDLSCGAVSSPIHYSPCPMALVSPSPGKVIGPESHIISSPKPQSTFDCESNETKCLCCEKSFKSEKILATHMRQFHQQFKSDDYAKKKPDNPRCHVCDKLFSKKTYLNSHMRVQHAEIIKYECDLCDKSFQQASHLKAHRTTHTCEQCNKTYKEAKNLEDYIQNRHKTLHECVHSEEARLRTCSYCDKQCASPYYLQCHMRSHTRKDLISCSNCPKQFNNIGLYSAHRCDTVGANNLYKCMDCDETFILLKEYKIHRRKHDQKPQRCPLCPGIFKSRRSIQIHLVTHNGKNGEKPHVCPKCNKSFAEVRELNAHFSVHTGEPMNTCSTCGKSFGSGQTLHFHKLMNHTGKIPYPCQFCDKGFATKTLLRLHTRRHTGERPHICEQCGTTFMSLSHLNAHKRTHTGEKPYRCTHCERTFVDSKGMKRHLVFAHNKSRDEVGLQKPKPALCDICGLTLSSKSLKQHRLTHSNGCVICRQAKDDGLVSEGTPCPHPKKPKETKGVVKNVPCPVCDKLFSNKSNLKSHMYVHSEVKKYKCEVCDKLFGRAKHLRDHRTIHSGERPYICDQCGKTYKAARHLRGHVHNQHKTQHKCAHCEKTFTCSVKSFKSHQKECKQNLISDQDGLMEHVDVVEENMLNNLNEGPDDFFAMNSQISIIENTILNTMLETDISL